MNSNDSKNYFAILTPKQFKCLTDCLSIYWELRIISLSSNRSKPSNSVQTLNSLLFPRFKILIKQTYLHFSDSLLCTKLELTFLDSPRGNEGMWFLQETGSWSKQYQTNMRKRLALYQDKIYSGFPTLRSSHFRENLTCSSNATASKAWKQWPAFCSFNTKSPASTGTFLSFPFF